MRAVVATAKRTTELLCGKGDKRGAKEEQKRGGKGGSSTRSRLKNETPPTQTPANAHASSLSINEYL